MALVVDAQRFAALASAREQERVVNLVSLRPRLVELLVFLWNLLFELVEKFQGGVLLVRASLGRSHLASVTVASIIRS